ncbi:MAG TPA: DUF4252 domain-containing protein [Bacteroidetes bacterium]|nr:DUF4252 domain-containing protein [Bacteroidota bacterium]
MKNFLLAIFLLSVPMLAFSQNKALNKFYRKHKKGKQVQNMKVPGWLIRFGGKIAIKNSDMDKGEEELARDLIKQAGGVKFMYSEDGVNIPQKSIQKLMDDLHKDSFDDLILIKQGQMDFQIMIQEVDGIVKNLFMFYNDRVEGEMAFVSMKMKLELDEVTKLVEKGMEEKYHDLIIEEEEPVVEPVM